jgi:hypothetical protein
MKTLLARIARILPKQKPIKYQPKSVSIKATNCMYGHDMDVEWAIRAQVLRYTQHGEVYRSGTLIPWAHPQKWWDLMNRFWSAEMDTCIQELRDGTDKPANFLLHIIDLVAQKGYVPNAEQQAFLDAFDGSDIDEDIFDTTTYKDYACGWDVVLRKPTPGAGDKNSPFPVVQAVKEEA